MPTSPTLLFLLGAPTRVFQGVGMGAVGMLGVWMGVHGFRNGRQLALTHAARYAWYEGRAARWGSVWMVVLGAAIVMTGLVWGAGYERTLFACITSHPGLALVPYGVAQFSSGIAATLGFTLVKHPEREVVRMPVAGLGQVLLGTLAITVGIFEVVFPSLFDSLWRATLEALRTSANR